MNLPSSSNSSGTIGTTGRTFCACCHHESSVRPHWGNPAVKTCEACRALLFHLEAYGELTPTVVSFHLRMQAGDL